jgi:hypothetical protein
MPDAQTLEDMSPGLFKVVERAQREPEGRFHLPEDNGFISGVIPRLRIANLYLSKAFRV